MKIAIITDIHSGAVTEAKYGPGASSLLRTALAMAAGERPDAVIDLGDHINNESAERDAELLRGVGAVLAECKLPLYALAGNHDLKNLSLCDAQRALGRELGSRSITLSAGIDNDLRLILWAANVSLDWNEGFRVRENDVVWLDSELRRSTTPAIVFSHVPFGGASSTGNYYFGHRPRAWAEYAEAGEIRRVVEQSERCIACVAGHVHRNAIQVVDGIAHLALQSLTEMSTTGGTPAAAWSILEMQGRALRVDVHGRDPFRLELSVKDPQSHWLVNPETTS